MRHEAIFLAGDAAHVHSPIGGQGMNAGIQDAYNLAWKLALVIKGKAKQSILDTYQLERYPIVSEIVKQTEDFTKLVLFDNTFLTKLRKISHEISHEDTLTKKISNMISQTSFQYKDSPIIPHYEQLSIHSPKPGQRAPDVIIDHSGRLYDHLRNKQHNILIFADHTTKQLKELQQWIAQTYDHLINTHVISREPLSDVENNIVDRKNDIHKHYHVKDHALYILRPDNYIGYCSNKIDQSLIDQYFKNFII
jgi:hypothetical protein